MMDKKAIEARIAELRDELGRAEGTPTEVYSRIVGYYRSVRNWNAGKREEYGKRLVFDMPTGASLRGSAAGAAPTAPAARPKVRPKTMAEAQSRAQAASGAAVAACVPSPVSSPDAGIRDGLLVFTRETCPNCPPVASYVHSSGVKAVFVDVDGDEGLALARNYGVMATPTVLALDGEGREAFRAFDIKGLRSKVEDWVRGASFSAVPVAAH